MMKPKEIKIASETLDYPETPESKPLASHPSGLLESFRSRFRGEWTNVSFWALLAIVAMMVLCSMEISGQRIAMRHQAELMRTLSMLSQRTPKVVVELPPPKSSSLPLIVNGQPVQSSLSDLDFRDRVYHEYRGPMGRTVHVAENAEDPLTVETR